MCLRYAKKQPSEPLKPSVPPSLPWKKIGTDLFEFCGEHYLLSVCYRSKFIKVTKLEFLRSGAVIEELKRQFGVLSVSDECYEEFQNETNTDPELQGVLAMVKMDGQTQKYKFL